MSCELKTNFLQLDYLPSNIFLNGPMSSYFQETTLLIVWIYL